MNAYEEKKQARIERMRERASSKLAFAKENDLSLYGEAKSGIPMGQPILIGHHSERRHRRHLERIENRVRKGYEALEESERLEERANAAESRTAIDSDNPEALTLINEKIEGIQKSIEYSKRINKLLSPFSRVDVYKTIDHFNKIDSDDARFIVKHLSSCAHFYACKDTRMLTLSTTNSAAEIRRLKKRIPELQKVQSGFEPFNVGEISVGLVNGQIQVTFPRKPDEKTRDKIKGAGIALKWSSFSKKWVRKHTASTKSTWFIQQLKEALTNATYE